MRLQFILGSIVLFVNVGLSQNTQSDSTQSFNTFNRPNTEYIKIKNRLSIFVSPTQACLTEISLFADYLMNESNSVGCSIGYETGTKDAVFYLSPSQDNYPSIVWHGLVARLNYKNFVTERKRFYVSTQLLYKNLSFKNQGFEDDLRDVGIDWKYTRNEKSYLWAIELVIGNVLTKKTSHFYAEVFYGISLRYRVRNGTTTYSNYDFIPAYATGNYSKIQTYPTAVFGVKIGFNTFIKQK